jgi:hypothetical protein
MGRARRVLLVTPLPECDLGPGQGRRLAPSLTGPVALLGIPNKP